MTETWNKNTALEVIGTLLNKLRKKDCMIKELQEKLKQTEPEPPVTEPEPPVTEPEPPVTEPEPPVTEPEPQKKPIRRAKQVSTSYSCGDSCPCRQFESDEYPYVCEICRRELYSFDTKKIHVCPDFDICKECAKNQTETLLFTRYSPFVTDSCACENSSGKYETDTFNCDNCSEYKTDNMLHFCPNFNLCRECFDSNKQISLDQKYYCNPFSPYY